MADETLRLRVTVDNQEAMTGLAQTRKSIEQTGQATKKANEQSAEAYKKAARELKAYNDMLMQAGQRMTGFSLTAAGAGAAVGALAVKIGRELYNTFNDLSTIGMRSRALSSTVQELRGLQYELAQMGLSSSEAEQQVRSLRDTMDDVKSRVGLYNQLYDMGFGKLAEQLKETNKLSEFTIKLFEFADKLDDRSRRDFARDAKLRPELFFSDRRQQILKSIEEEPTISAEKQKRVEEQGRNIKEFWHKLEQMLDRAILGMLGGITGEWLFETPAPGAPGREPRIPERGALPPGMTRDMIKRMSLRTGGDDAGGDEGAIRIVARGVFEGMQQFRDWLQGGGTGGGGGGEGGGGGGGGGDSSGLVQKASYSPSETPTTTDASKPSTSATPNGQTPADGSKPAAPADGSKPAGTPDASKPKESGAVVPGLEGPSFRTANNPEVQKYIGFANTIKNMNPEMQARIMSAYRAMPDHVKKSFVLNEGWRSHEYQKFLYSTRSGRGMVARPGHSRHEKGTAIDVDRGAARDWLRKYGKEHGISDLPGDAPHFQMDKSGRQFDQGRPEDRIPVPEDPKQAPGPTSMIDEAIKPASAEGRVNVTVNSNGPKPGGGSRDGMFQQTQVQPRQQMVHTKSQRA